MKQLYFVLRDGALALCTQPYLRPADRTLATLQTDDSVRAELREHAVRSQLLHAFARARKAGPSSADAIRRSLHARYPRPELRELFDNVVRLALKDIEVVSLDDTAVLPVCPTRPHQVPDASAEFPVLLAEDATVLTGAS